MIINCKFILVLSFYRDHSLTYSTYIFTFLLNHTYLYLNNKGNITLSFTASSTSDVPSIFLNDLRPSLEGASEL